MLDTLRRIEAADVADLRARLPSWARKAQEPAALASATTGLAGGLHRGEALGGGDGPRH